MNDVATMRDEDSASHFSTVKKDKFKSLDIDHLIRSTDKIISSPEISKSSKRGSPILSSTAKGRMGSSRKA